MTMRSFPVHHGRYRDLAAALGASIARVRREGDPASWLASPVTVLIPSRGSGEAIIRSILDETGRGVAGIELVTPDTLAQRILNANGDFPRVASNEERVLAMELAVREMGDAAFASPAMPVILSRSLRDVRDTGLTIDELAQRLAPRARRDERLRLAIRAWRRYEAIIASLGSIDPADLLIRAAGMISKGHPPAAVIVFGFYDATGTQQRLIDALAGRGRLESVWIPCPPADDDGGDEAWAFARPFASHMASLGGSACRVPRMPGTPSLQIAVESTRRRELVEICRRVAELVHGGAPAASIGVVARAVQPYERAILGETAPSFGLRIPGCGGTPVHAHRMVRGVRALLRLRERSFPRRDIIEILESRPMRKGLVLSIEVIGRLDDVLRRNGIAGGSGDSLRHSIQTAIAANEAAGELLRRYEEIVATLEPIAPETSKPMRGGQWAGILESLSDLFRIDTEADLAIDESLAGVASQLRRIDRLGPVIDVEQVIRLVDSGGDIENGDTDGESIWLGDVMTFRGRSFDHLFVYGVEEQLFPQGRSPDPILSESVRSSAGMRQIGDGLAEERLLFRLLQDGASKSVRLSFARIDDRGKPSRPSRFARAVAIAQEPDHKREISGDYAKFLRASPEPAASVVTAEEARIAALRRGELEKASLDGRMKRRLQYASRIGTESSFDGYLEVDDAIRASLLRRLERISPTHLEDFGECPQRFLMTRLLFVRDIEDPDEELEIEPKKKGTLAHRILERFYQTIEDREIAGKAGERALDPVLSTRLQAIIAEELDRFDQSHPPFLNVIRRIERGALTRVLSEFVVRDLAELDRSGYRPREFERSFGRSADETRVEIEAGGIALGLSGAIDRIDENPDSGFRRVVDYKLGTASHLEQLSKKIDKGRALQLAMYALATTVLYDCEPSKVEGAIRPLQSAANPSTFSFQLGEKRQRLQEILDGFVAHILAGRFPAYVARGEGNCTYCPVNHSCRVLFDPRLKNVVQLSESALDLLEGGNE